MNHWWHHQFNEIEEKIDRFNDLFLSGKNWKSTTSKDKTTTCLIRLFFSKISFRKCFTFVCHRCRRCRHLWCLWWDFFSFTLSELNGKNKKKSDSNQISKKIGEKIKNNHLDRFQIFFQSKIKEKNLFRLAKYLFVMTNK